LAWRNRFASSYEAPKNVEPFITAAAIVGGASLAYSVGKDLLPTLKSKEAIVFFIRDSEFVGSRPTDFKIIIEVINVSRHGAYIDEIELIRPENCEFGMGRSDDLLVARNEKSMGPEELSFCKSYGSTIKSGILIDGESRKYIILKMICDLDKEFWLNPIGTIKATLSPLNESKPRKPVSINFRLRGN